MRASSNSLVMQGLQMRLCEMECGGLRSSEVHTEQVQGGWELLEGIGGGGGGGWLLVVVVIFMDGYHNAEERVGDFQFRSDQNERLRGRSIDRASSSSFFLSSVV